VQRRVTSEAPRRPARCRSTGRREEIPSARIATPGCTLRQKTRERPLARRPVSDPVCSSSAGTSRNHRPSSLASETEARGVERPGSSNWVSNDATREARVPLSQFIGTRSPGTLVTTDTAARVCPIGRVACNRKSRSQSPQFFAAKVESTSTACCYPAFLTVGRNKVAEIRAGTALRLFRPRNCERHYASSEKPEADTSSIMPGCPERSTGAGFSSGSLLPSFSQTWRHVSHSISKTSSASSSFFSS